MTWAATAVGVGTAVAGMVSSADSARKAARAKQKAAAAYQNHVDQVTAQAQGMITPAMMATHDQALHAQERQVVRQEQLAQSINPALIEQGHQLMQLMQGQSAPVLDNMKNQRGLQRQQLVSQLKEQLGPGAETSSAGQQALQHFDAETSNQMSSAQQQYTQMFLQGSLQAPGAMNTFGNANAQLSGINAQDPNITKANLLMQSIGGGAPAAQSIIDSAGGQFAGQAAMGQGMVGIGSGIMQAGAARAGSQSVNKPGTLGGDAAPSGGGFGTDDSLSADNLMARRQARGF